MKTFLVQYISEGNVFAGKRTFEAESIGVAQAMFFEWLKQQTTFQHLWRLEFFFEEINK